MKNTIAFILAVMMLLPLFGCDENNDLSSDVLNNLTESVGSDEHTHEEAETPQTVSDPISGYCGNLVTKIVTDDGEQSFGGEDSVTLTDIVINMDYKDGICKCREEFNVYTETESQPYGVNLTEAYVRYDGKQADLTEEQVNTIRSIYDRQYSEKVAKDF